MACRDAYEKAISVIENIEEKSISNETVESNNEKTVRLLFGVDSAIPSNDILQNNITEFEWVTRNKLYPNFWGRNITGENALTKEEIEFLHGKGCKIAAIYESSDAKDTEEQGKTDAAKIDILAVSLGIPEGSVIFMDVSDSENVTSEYMKGFAESIITNGYTPGFRADTDSKHMFNREFSRGMLLNSEVFDKCLIWAVSPSLSEYDGIKTAHLIHPDEWKPFAPSAIKRNEIAIWQYGKNCHPIDDDNGNATTFNLNLICDEKIIIEKMF